jgi:ankyrin repeat protein
MGSCEIVQQLLSAGARVDATDAQGRTALHHACGGGHVEVARLLISWGAALTLRTVYGEAPMVRCLHQDAA